MAQPELIKDIEARVKKSGDIMTGTLKNNLFLSNDNNETNGGINYGIHYNDPTIAQSGLGSIRGEYTLALLHDCNFTNGAKEQLIGERCFYYNDTDSWNHFPSALTMEGDGKIYYLYASDGLASRTQYQKITMNKYEILHTGNTNLIDNRYVLKTGDTMTGNLTAPQFNGYLNGIAYQSYIPYGFTRYDTTGGWGLQTGTCLIDWGESDGGDIDIRKNCPNSGQISIKVDGRFYQNEGQYMCLDTNNFSGYALPLIGGTMSGWINFASIASWPTVSGETYPINSNGLYWVGSSDWARIFYRVSASDTGNLVVQLGDDTNCNFIIENSAGTVYSTINNRGVSGAIWNDYAEYRKAESIEPGRVVIESADGEMKLSTERLQPGAEIISDTFGFAIGETDEYKTPIAATGRVLAYPNEDRYSYPLGCAVCSGPNGTVSQMTREEIREYPERIIGTVSEIPEYKNWGTGNVKVNGRIWIRIK